MVGGIIVVAVAVDLTISHPSGHLPAATAILAGPAIYLAGNTLFNFTVIEQVPWSRLIGILALGALTPSP